MLNNLCWKCGKDVGELPYPVPFRAECPACASALHCCKNCKYYSPGKPNDCIVPGTEFVSDRERVNFCEEYKMLGTFTQPEHSVDDISKKLFGDDE